MKTLNLVAYAALALTACSAAPNVESAIPQPVCETADIQGNAADVEVAQSVVEGIQVGELVTCEPEKGGYLRLEGSGWRTLVMGRGDIEGLAGCTVEAVRAGAADGCPKVQFDSFGGDVAKQMQASGLQHGGLGLGACGDINGGYDQWNPSIIFSDWRLVDPAARISAKLMAELQIGNHFGVSTRAPMCFQLLEGRNE